MQINVSLRGVLKTDSFKDQLCEFPAEYRVDDIVTELNVSRRLLGIILINGRHANLDSTLKDGDQLMLLPLLEGG